MRWRVVHLLGIVFAALVILSPGVFSQNIKTLVIKPKSGEFADTELYTNSHAVLIGISQYQHLPKDKWLRFAHKDAEEMYEVLVRSYGFLPENVTVLMNEQATKQNIEKALSRLANRRFVQPNDRLLIFFSGHGQTVKVGNAERGFLIPYDADVDLKDPMNAGPYVDTCLPMKRVWEYVDNSPAKHALVLADACFSGLLAAPRPLLGNLRNLKPSRQQILKWVNRPAKQVITAGRADEETIELPERGHGAFTFKLLEELKSQAANADDVFSAFELGAVLKITVDRETQSNQTPFAGNYDNTEGDFVFVTTPPRPVPPLNALKPSGSPGGLPLLGQVRINPKDGAVMVFIPAGTFQMGCNDGTASDIEKPVHTQRVEGFYMYKHEVTVAQYRRFCQATGRQMPEAPRWGWKDDHPIVNVSWHDAIAYCQWAGVRLPTEAEWEYAARGGKQYEYGTSTGELNPGLANYGQDFVTGSTKPVGSYPANPFGLFDMAGNVWEWCSSFCGPYPYAANDGRENLNEDADRVLRGGAWQGSHPLYVHCAARSYCRPAFTSEAGGFRCAQSR